MHNFNLPLHRILIGILLIPIPALDMALLPELGSLLPLLVLLLVLLLCPQGLLPTWSAARDANCATATSTLADSLKSQRTPFGTITHFLSSSLPFLFQLIFAFIFALEVPSVWPLNRLCFALIIIRIECKNQKSYFLLWQMQLVFIAQLCYQ